MKRLRVAGHLLGARSRVATTSTPHTPSPILPATTTSPSGIRLQRPACLVCPQPTRSIHTPPAAYPRRSYSSAAASPAAISDAFNDRFQDLHPHEAQGIPSPPPSRAPTSAKLGALHARLQLPTTFPVQSLARCLIDSSADENLQFNNVHPAFLGRTITNYHISEWLMARYPRLPMEIFFAAMKGYAGDRSLYAVAMQWGVEMAAAPGEEVDPGLLQFDPKTSALELDAALGYKRKESEEIIKFKWRRGISSRVVFDDEFGDTVSAGEHERLLEREVLQWRADRGLLSEQEMLQFRDPVPMEIETANDRTNRAYASLTRAVVGSVFLHGGRDAAKAFVHNHILSRRLELADMFLFSRPTRELARLCAREGFERPVARLHSETGRLTRTPVFVVGIYSGEDVLGTGEGPSLDTARIKAAINSLKAWYLYSPGEGVRLPSETLNRNSKGWDPLYVDIGEVIV